MSQSVGFVCYDTIQGLVGPFARCRFCSRQDFVFFEVEVPADAVVGPRRGSFTVGSRIRLLRQLPMEEVALTLAGDQEVVFNSARFWMRDGQFHRDEDDEPAVISGNGSKSWWVRHMRHRAEGRPAVERADGSVEFWVWGERKTASGEPWIPEDMSDEEHSNGGDGLVDSADDIGCT